MITPESHISTEILSSPRPASHSTLPAINPGVLAAQVGVAYKQSLEMRDFWFLLLTMGISILSKKPGVLKGEAISTSVSLEPSCARTRSALKVIRIGSTRQGNKRKTPHPLLQHLQMRRSTCAKCPHSGCIPPRHSSAIRTISLHNGLHQIMQKDSKNP